MNNDFIKYANSFQTVINLGLNRISRLLELSGNPQNALKCIHVAGTNGKGSVCAFLDNIITRSGYVCGKFTSPNLVRVNERITVSGVEITDDELHEILSSLELLSKKVKESEGDAPTQFELWTAAAFIYFERKKCDYVVLETGLGGTYDATNVITTNVCSVITSIDFDHMAYLGNTLSSIASAKCGIIKEGCPVITINQPPEAMQIIKDAAREKGAQLIVADDIRSHSFEDMHEVFSYDNIENIKSALGGIYQTENAAMAISAARLLGIKDKTIREGIETAHHRARFEKISDTPFTIFDGGHNKAGIRALIASLDRYFPNLRQTVIFACMRDKEIKPSLAALNNGKRRFIFTTVQDNERTMLISELSATARSVGIEGESAPTLKEAIQKAKTYANMIVICGSLYLYKDLF